MQIVAPDEFDARFGNLFRALFCDVQVRRASFVNPSWQLVLIAGEVPIRPPEFDWLAAAARRCGDDAFVVTDFETLPPHQYTRVLPWDFEIAEHACNEALCAFQCAIFGRSGAWGGLCSKRDASIVGGEPAFIEAFLDAAGSLDHVRVQFAQNFLTFALDADGRKRPDEDVMRDWWAEVGWA